jgi:hypothetical protein
MKLPPIEEATREDVEKAIVRWRETNFDRLEVERSAKAIKKTEDQLKSFLLEVFKVQKLEGMIIDGRSTGLSTKKGLVVSDKEAFLAYVKQEQALDLLQFRMAEGAVKERMAEGIQVPGTEETEFYDLFDRKV